MENGLGNGKVLTQSKVKTCGAWYDPTPFPGNRWVTAGHSAAAEEENRTKTGAGRLRT